MSGATEYRSATSDINPSILASRLRALFVFMTTPFTHNDFGDHCRSLRTRPRCAAFFCRRLYAFLFAALTAAQRFLDASAIAFLSAALIFRFGLADAVAGFDGSDSPRIFAQRRCWASLILRRAAEENFRRLGEASLAAAAVFAEPPVRRFRSSAICWSIRVFCDS